MTESPARYRRSRSRTPVSPINFRMPSPLRARLRRFAEERALGESDALRLALAEHLDEIEDERQLLAAERWQFKQAYATWQQWKQGGRKGTVGWEEIERIFEDALASRTRRKRGTK